jgi:uncharacterized protein YpmB
MAKKCSRWVIAVGVIFIALLDVCSNLTWAQSSAPLASVLDNEKHLSPHIETLRVSDLVAMIKTAKDKPVIFDANSDSIRAKYGVIPGAHLLSSASSYDVTRELPPNKLALIVFYCSNSH